MKKFFKSTFAILIGLSLTVVGCKKSGTDPADPNDPNNNGTVPTSFTQKVMLEEYTGAWCGWCVDGHYNVKQIAEVNPNLVPVMIHQGDAMETTDFATYFNPAFKVTGFPMAAVQRVKTPAGLFVMSRPWNTPVANASMTKAALGLSIDATFIEDPSAVTPKVKIAFAEDVSVPLYVGVYVVEDSVSGTGSTYDQKNFLANRPGYESSPFYSKPAVLIGYKHNHVLRRALYPSPQGVLLDSTLTKKGKVIEFSRMFSYNGCVKENSSIVAFVHTPGGKVYNVQIVKVGKAKAWD